MSDSDNNMRREIDSLKEIMEAKMETMEANNKTAHAESETATERLRTDFGDLRTDMEKNINSLTMKMIGVVAAGVAVLGGFIAILQFLK